MPKPEHERVKPKSLLMRTLLFIYVHRKVFENYAFTLCSRCLPWPVCQSTNHKMGGGQTCNADTLVKGLKKDSASNIYYPHNG